jgi:UDP-2,3-diacylglucosamine pyrophosphatase LpxH
MKQIFQTTRYLLGILIFSGWMFISQAQDSIQHRLILIGDAGEITEWQKSTIELAARQVIPGKTTVIYLGDNIYPRGIGLPGSATEEGTKDILRSQYQPMRERGAPVYFIPGNHDWDRSGVNGLARIQYQGQFLREQNDSG